jgi:tetratricopeptide (TPR) repeat protein
LLAVFISHILDRMPKRFLHPWLSLLLILIVSWPQIQAADAQGTRIRNTKPKKVPYRTRIQSECWYISEAVITDLIEMMLYAKTQTLPPPESIQVQVKERKGSKYRHPIFDVTITTNSSSEPFKGVLDVAGPMWSPDTFLPLARELATHIDFKPSTATPSHVESWLSRLLDFSPVTFAKVEREISAGLKASFQDPLLHEQAALIVGLFALREESGDFYHAGLDLCRITPHLVMSALIRGDNPMSVEGKIADIVLETLMNNQVRALEKLKTLPETDSKLIPWKRALQAWNTHDYRALKNASQETLSHFERIARFRAECNMTDATRVGAEFLKDLQDFPSTDWGRILYAEGYSVSLGRMLSETLIPLELKEITEVHEILWGVPLPREELILSLNRFPSVRCLEREERGIEIRVLAWGHWAAAAQRHLCHAIHHGYSFIKDSWDEPEAAAEFKKATEKTFGDLLLFPFVRRYNARTREEYIRSVDECGELVLDHPHLSPAEAWMMIYETPNFSPRHFTLENGPSWSTHTPPPGTAYNARTRARHSKLSEQKDYPAQVEDLFARAPYDYATIDRWFYRHTSKDPSPEERIQGYGGLLEYSFHALERVAHSLRNDSAQFEKYMTKAAEMDPEAYYELYEHFKDRAVYERAAEYLEKAISLGEDAVRASNAALWLVKYYIRTERLDLALKHGEKAAETHSARGLEAGGLALEASGRVYEAFLEYCKIMERYNDHSAVASALIRNPKISSPKIHQQFGELLLNIFPSGIAKVKFDQLKQEPSSGILFRQLSDKAKAAGLQIGDVVVAINGLRVSNMPQYYTVMDSSISEEYEFFVWRKNQYHHLKIPVPGARFGGNVSTYQYFKEVFPSGLVAITLEDLKNRPAPGGGVHIDLHSRDSDRVGLKRYDTIVAIDGKKVDDLDQYKFLMELGDDETFSFIVWRKDRYLEVGGDVPDRDLGIKAKILDPEKAFFPNGIQKVTLSALSQKPLSGIRVEKIKEPEDGSIQKGDILVAINGIKVENLKQYRHCMNSAESTHYQFIIWRDAKHLEVEQSIPKRILPAQLSMYSGLANETVAESSTED